MNYFNFCPNNHTSSKISYDFVQTIREWPLFISNNIVNQSGLVLACSDAQNVQWWIEMCSDERLFVQWQKRSFGNLAG